MDKLCVLIIFGTRPEAVKLAPLIKVMKRDERFDLKICVTAQHRQMLDQVLEIFSIEPDFDLNIMSQRQTLAEVTSRALAGVDEVITKVKPDVVLVQGDTATVFVGALAAFYQKVKVGHVEAGLRTFKKYDPFPEEIARVLTSRLADFHFAPTGLSKRNLLEEKVPEESVYITGNTAVDALDYTVNNLREFKASFLNGIDFENKKVIAVTAHRRENLGEPLANICRAFKRLIDEFDDVEIVYSVHLNPLVLETVKSVLGGESRVHLTETPLDLLDMHNLFNKSYFIMTDSGGIQEEAPALNKPVLVLRNTTERPEGVETGALKLAGTDEEHIYALACELLTNQDVYDRMANARNPYGDGKASERIAEALLYEFGLTSNKPKDFME
jgi:UDP-N-acetylglucosamine 2-epimerase